MKKLQKKLKAIVWICIAAVSLGTFWNSGLEALGQEEEKVIRVGFPEQAGFSMQDENGVCSGYTYDYLMEIAQYTGWKYEFVRIPGDMDTQLTTLTEMLEAGEIDLLGAMTYSESLAKIYDYPGYSYGLGYTALCVYDDNKKLNSSNYIDMDKIRVAIVETYKTRISEMDQFALMNGLKIEYVYCENAEKMYEAVENGEADAILFSDLAIPEGYRVIVKFSPKPFYFATTKGNTEIVKGLNRAISSINEMNPYFSARLSELYFTPDASGLNLTSDETEYIKSAGTLNVLIKTGMSPIQGTDMETGAFKGITKDVLEYIGEHVGIQFDYTCTNDDEEYERLLKSGEFDLVGGFPNDYTIAGEQEVILTQPYVNTAITMVINDRVNPNELSGKTLAMVRNFEFKDPYHAWYHCGI